MRDIKRIFWALTLFAFLVLGAAAVWLGGLNQDEGWYLYAANLTGDGLIPFRDFFFTQGPTMPRVYALFRWIWSDWGLLGARVFTLAVGVVGIVLGALTARRLAPDGKGGIAALVTAMLLGCNLYHLYYLAIPKTYALASFFVMLGCWAVVRSLQAEGLRNRIVFAFFGGYFLAQATGTRVSMGAILAVAGTVQLLRRRWWPLFALCFGAVSSVLVVHYVYLFDYPAREAFLASLTYHSSRGGSDIVWTVGSLSRLVRWYLPLFVVLGLGVAGKMTAAGRVRGSGTGALAFLLWSFLAVFAVQILAPFPYEDYQVPVMVLLAVYAAVTFAAQVKVEGKGGERWLPLLLVLGLSYACSFGSPLLEKWMTNGQDRFWSLKKEKCEMAQLRDVARRIEKLDPNGRTLLTQDLYLAVETNRRVPRGLEMGPFSILSDEDWRKLLSETAPAECPIAALSGYTFAINPPKCDERPIEQQMSYWGLLKKSYGLVDREERFGQNATPLLILKRK